MSTFDQPKTKSGARRVLRVAVASFVILAAAILLEHWRGQRALADWQSDMTARGEVFDPAQLWPPPAASTVSYSNRLTQAAIKLPAGFNYYGSMMQGIAEGSAGKARRGSQEPWPLVHSPYGTNSWAALDAVARQAAPKVKVPPMILGAAQTGSGRRAEFHRGASDHSRIFEEDNLGRAFMFVSAARPTLKPAP